MGINYPPPLKNPFLSLPDGWDRGWRAAISAAQQGTAPAWVTVVGDSISQGAAGVSNPGVGEWPMLLWTSLCNKYGLAKDRLYRAPANAAATDVFWANGSNLAAVTTRGWHTCLENGSTTSAQAYVTLTLPFACTKVELIYLDPLNSGSFKYQVAGQSLSGAITTTAPTGGNQGLSAHRKVTITGAGLTQGNTIGVGWASGAHCLYLVGANMYSGNTGLGMGVYAVGGESFGLLTPYTTTPYDRISTFSGCLAADGGNYPWPPVQPPGPNTCTGGASGAPTAAVGGAGTVAAGTYFYFVTFVGCGDGGGGESVLGPASGSVTLNGSQAGSLTAIPTALVYTNGTGNNNAIFGVTKRNIYRGTSSNGTGALLVGTISDNTTTTFTDNSAGTTSPPVANPSPAAAGFGFPLQPHLLIVMLGINDGGSLTPNNITNGLKRFIEAARRGQPNINGSGYFTSILVIGQYFPDTTSGEVLSTSGANPDEWPQTMTAVKGICDAKGCAFLSLPAEWGEDPITNSRSLGNGGALIQNFGIHPTNSGHVAILNRVASVL